MDLRNGEKDNLHGTRLKFYLDDQMDTEAIIPHVLSSQTGMPVSRLMQLIDDLDGSKVLVRWKGLPTTEDSLEPINRVYQDVSKMFLRLLRRKNTPPDLAAKVRRALGLQTEDCNQESNSVSLNNCTAMYSCPFVHPLLYLEYNGSVLYVYGAKATYSPLDLN